MPCFTVGHSNRGIEELTALLAAADIGMVADVRKIPRSAAHPQFNADTLAAALARSKISYQWIEALGGRRPKSRNIPPEVNAFWNHQSFHNYADYALSDEFRAALERLLEVSHRQRCAIMCSEALWWRCHRRIIADHLIARGETVTHIMAAGRLVPARLTAAAVIQPDGTVCYPRADR